MIIRPATLNDTDRIAELYQQLFVLMAEYQPDRWRPAQQDRGFIENAVADENFVCWLRKRKTVSPDLPLHRHRIPHLILVWCRAVSVISLILWLIRQYAGRAPVKNCWMLSKPGQKSRDIHIWSYRYCRKIPAHCGYMSVKVISR